MDKIKCPTCEGSRLKKESLYFKINSKNIAELSQMDVVDLAEWFKELPNHLSESQINIKRNSKRNFYTTYNFF